MEDKGILKAADEEGFIMRRNWLIAVKGRKWSTLSRRFKAKLYIQIRTEDKGSFSGYSEERKTIIQLIHKSSSTATTSFPSRRVLPLSKTKAEMEQRNKTHNKTTHPKHFPKSIIVT